MAVDDYDPRQIGELGGFVRGFAKLQEALSIERYEYQVDLLTIEGEVEETLQRHFDALGQKLRPPVRHWDLTIMPLEEWQQALREVASRWLTNDPELHQFYEERRLADRRPGEAHLGEHDVARAFVQEVERLVGKRPAGVWQVTMRALVGSQDRYLATLDDHIVIGLDGALLLVSFSMNR
ncbi:MAG: hypothetical protein ACXVYM_07640 [Gaiellaceae bacterium]